MKEIPYRVWYPVDEIAQLRGCSPELIYLWIRRGQQKNPTGEHIPPSLVLFNGRNKVVHRSVAFPHEPGPNVAPMTNTTLTDEQIDRVIGRWLARLGMLAERRQVA